MSRQKNLANDIRRMLSEGVPPAAIAQTLGCSRVNVYKHAKNSRVWSGYVRGIEPQAQEKLLDLAERAGVRPDVMAARLLAAVLADD